MSGSTGDSGKFGDKLEELDLTADEIHRLTEAMKKKEFRDLLAEYAKEIQDPENKKRYEEEIKLMEGERGVDVKFISPTPGHVIKTVQNGDTKCFVNICYSNTIDTATCTKSPQNKGEHWSIPYSTAAGREDVDKAGSKCVVYDCVFHEDTYKRGLRDSRFKKLIHDTALQGIESQLNVQLDKVNLKFPKLKFKGVVQPTMIRRKKEDDGSGDHQNNQAVTSNGTENEGKSELQEQIKEKLKFPFPYPVPGEESNESKYQQNTMKNNSVPKGGSENLKRKGVKVEVEDCVEFEGKVYTVPNYTIVHRGYSDMQNSVELPDSKLHVTRPKELVVQITLPLLNSAKTVSLDVLRKQLVLHCETPACYRLDIALPYPVEEEKGSARFDKMKKKLIVTLPVVPPETSAAVSIPIEEQSSSPQKSAALVKEIVPEKSSDNERAEKSPTESVEETSQNEAVSIDELPEADQAVRSLKTKAKDSQDSEDSAKGKATAKKHNLSKDCEKYFENWPSSELKIPEDLERQLDALPDGWFKKVNPKSSRTSKNVKTFPADPFLYEVDVPKYKVTQRVDNLTMILQEKRIRSNLLEVKPFKNDNGLHIRLCSVGENDCNKWFYMYVEFDAESKCAIDRDSIKTDVNELNCVILMDKAEHCRKVWPFLKVGPCKDTLKIEYLDLEAKVEKMNEDLFANYHSPHLPMHVVDPICTPEQMTLTLRPGRDPKDEQNSDNEELCQSQNCSGKDSERLSRKSEKVQKYSKTAEEISALIQAGKLDDAIAKELEMEQKKESDQSAMSKDDVTSCTAKFDHVVDIIEDGNDDDEKIGRTIEECRRIVSQKYFPKKDNEFFAEDGFMLKSFEEIERARANGEPLHCKNDAVENRNDSENAKFDERSERCASAEKENLSLDLNEDNDADNEKKNSEDSSPREVAPNGNNSKFKYKNVETKAMKKNRKKQQQKSQRARLMSHSSDDDQTRVNTYKNVEISKAGDKSAQENGQQKNAKRNGSYDSASTSPAQSPREGEEETIGGGKERGSRRGAMSGDDEDYYTHTYSSARPIIKRACRSCAEGEDSETENSLRKSVSFCEDVDVVNIKTTTTKAARKSAKKTKKKQKRRPASADESEEEKEEGQGQVEVKEQATWNKIPLSTVPLTFDLD